MDARSVLTAPPAAAQHAAGIDDPITAPFWEAAARRTLVIQRCRSCGTHQFYPRPFCLSCNADSLEWVAASGRATVYSQTTVRLQIMPTLAPPYVIALVDLDEGPRLLTLMVGPPCVIGDHVRLVWKERLDAPPLPVFERAEGEAR